MYGNREHFRYFTLWFSSRQILHTFKKGLFQIKVIPTVIYTIPQTHLPGKVNLSSFPISLFRVKLELTFGSFMVVGDDSGRI